MGSRSRCKPPHIGPNSDTGATISNRSGNNYQRSSGAAAIRHVQSNPPQPLVESLRQPGRILQRTGAQCQAVAFETS